MEYIHVDARGDACPIPVVKTRQAIATLPAEGGAVETLVDNEIAVQNLTKMADQKGYAVSTQQREADCWAVTLTVGASAAEAPAPLEQPAAPTGSGAVVVVSADHMGEGDERLGRTLLKAFLYALTQQDALPSAVLFYNGGAHLTCEGSDSLEDLRNLAEQGVEILTCGTCLNFYGLSEKLAVGGVTNMYDIVERQLNAARVVRP
ncbi:MAG: sulfurtransferase-like selenium metabolism protein YedF [Oscillospiraceae bacterium]|nr:sulfurtransferase-like selenium metabolism protein YedF [Oscillospiraceae bacterium]